MTFTQLSFLSAFLPLFLLAGILTRGKRISPNFHIASGLIFLLLWGVVPAAIFVGFIALNALVMGLKGKTRVIWAVLLNLGFIALYKLLPFWGRESWSFHVPLGISYAALQALSFHINQEKGSVVQLAHYLLLCQAAHGAHHSVPGLCKPAAGAAERLEDCTKVCAGSSWGCPRSRWSLTDWLCSPKRLKTAARRTRASRWQCWQP